MKKIDRLKKLISVQATAEDVAGNSEVKVTVQVPKDLLSNHDTLVQYRVEQPLSKLIETLVVDALGQSIAAADERVAEALQSLKPARKLINAKQENEMKTQAATPPRPAAA